MGLVLTSCDNCKNCKYYQAFYVKDKTRYKTAIGRCTNGKIADHNRKISPVAAYCEFKEQAEDKTYEQNVSIRAEITDMRKKLTQILEILENE